MSTGTMTKDDNKNDGMSTNADVSFQEDDGQTDTIWYRDPAGFMRDANVMHFIPTKDDPLPEQLNAIMRFAIYFTIVLLVAKRDINLLFIVIVVAAATYVIHESHLSDVRQKNETMEHLKLAQERDGELCVRPTKDNPFMNVTPVDLAEFPNRPKACNVRNKQVQNAMEDKYAFNLFRDVDDVFGRKTMSRQFYTMPNTTIPNDQTAFAEWLYKTGPTCKEGNGLQCVRNMQDAIPM